MNVLQALLDELYLNLKQSFSAGIIQVELGNEKNSRFC